MCIGINMKECNLCLCDLLWKRYNLQLYPNTDYQLCMHEYMYVGVQLRSWANHIFCMKSNYIQASILLLGIEATLICLSWNSKCLLELARLIDLSTISVLNVIKCSDIANVL